MILRMLGVNFSAFLFGGFGKFFYRIRFLWLSSNCFQTLFLNFLEALLEGQKKNTDCMRLTRWSVRLLLIPEFKPFEWKLRTLRCNLEHCVVVNSNEGKPHFQLSLLRLAITVLLDFSATVSSLSNLADFAVGNSGILLLVYFCDTYSHFTLL